MEAPQGPPERGTRRRVGNGVPVPAAVHVLHELEVLAVVQGDALSLVDDKETRGAPSAGGMMADGRDKARPRGRGPGRQSAQDVTRSRHANQQVRSGAAGDSFEAAYARWRPGAV